MLIKIIFLIKNPCISKCTLIYKIKTLDFEVYSPVNSIKNFLPSCGGLMTVRMSNSNNLKGNIKNILIFTKNMIQWIVFDIGTIIMWLKG